MKASPCEEVAVKTLTPTADAAAAALITLCSDSMVRNFASSSPSFTKSAICSIISVCGVIGKAGTTSTRQSFAPIATAWSPVITFFIPVPSPFLSHPLGIHWRIHRILYNNHNWSSGIPCQISCESYLPDNRTSIKGTLCIFPYPLPVSYTHLRAHETRHDLVCRLLLEKKKNT